MKIILDIVTFCALLIWVSASSAGPEPAVDSGAGEPSGTAEQSGTIKKKTVPIMDGSGCSSLGNSVMQLKSIVVAKEPAKLVQLTNSSKGSDVPQLTFSGYDKYLKKENFNKADLQIYLEKHPKYKSKVRKLATDIEKFVDEKAEKRRYRKHFTEALKKQLVQCLSSSKVRKLATDIENFVDKKAEKRSYPKHLTEALKKQLVQALSSTNELARITVSSSNNHQFQDPAKKVLQDALKETIIKLQRDRTDFYKIIRQLQPTPDDLAKITDDLNSPSDSGKHKFILLGDDAAYFFLVAQIPV